MARKLVALSAVVALALWLLWPRRSDLLHDVPSDVQLCKENLFAIYAGLIEYEKRFDRPPEGSGPAFLAALIAEGVWEDTPESRARLACPGPGAAPEGGGYAARDQARAPLPRFPAGGPERTAVVACANASGLNHDGVMNVLFTDRTIETLTLAQERERGRVPADATTIAVGPEATIEELTRLTTQP